MALSTGDSYLRFTANWEVTEPEIEPDGFFYNFGRIAMPFVRRWSFNLLGFSQFVFQVITLFSGVRK